MKAVTPSEFIRIWILKIEVTADDTYDYAMNLKLDL